MGVESIEEGGEKSAIPESWAVQGDGWVPRGVFNVDGSGNGSWLERQDRRLTAGKAHQCQARDPQVKLGKAQITTADILKVGIRKYPASGGAAGSPPAAGGRCDSGDIGLWAGPSGRPITRRSPSVRATVRSPDEPEVDE